MADLKDDIFPTATPSDDEIRRWQALPRDEQLRRMKALFDDPTSTMASTASMAEIRSKARAIIMKRDRG